MRAARVLLVGMMGSGKTSVGRALSQRTGWPYFDNDELVAALTGLPTADLLAERGEPALRTAEAQALARVLTSDPPVIAGVAGGVVESPHNRELLRSGHGFVVYLDTPLEVLVQRVGSGEGRPWLRPDPETALRRLLDGREPLYREVADLVVDTRHGGPADHARLVLEALERHQG